MFCPFLNNLTQELYSFEQGKNTGIARIMKAVGLPVGFELRIAVGDTETINQYPTQQAREIPSTVATSF